MIGAPLALALLQALPITAQAVVDRDRVAVGELVTFTITASSHSQGALSLVIPPLAGFEEMDRSERREVSGGARTVVWELHLAARTPGRYTLGPIQVVQGGVVGQAAAIEIEVVAEGLSVSNQISPRLRALLESAPAPPDSGAQVAILVSAPSAVVGQQVDVVTTAWFPRDLRLRLRRQPTLDPPSFSGVWSYPQPVPPGIIATRQVHGEWFDEFAYHQVVFPITPGPLDGTDAILHYSVPVAFQFFSQEDPYALPAKVPAIMVRGVPDSGRPAGFDGAVGSGLTLTREVDGTPRAGEPVEVRFVLSGRGNVSLWPAPFLRWSQRLQVYPEGTDEKLDVLSGILGGTKTFRYLVVPDSSGLLTIPSVEYQYYDVESGSFQRAEAAGIRIPVAPAASPVASRAEPPPLLLDSEPSFVWRVVHVLPRWAWLLVWLVPPFGLGLARLPRRARRDATPTAPLPAAVEAHHQLTAAIAAVVGSPGADGGALGKALRNAGADAAFAERVSRLNDRLAAERFAPLGGNPPVALLSEARTVTDRLRALGRRGRLRGASAIAVLLVAVLASGAAGQQVPAERLFETGAFRASLNAFRARAVAAPAVTANWYGYGASAYRLGEDGFAVAAWTRAAELSPRSHALTRAMLLLPAPDPASAEWRAVPPVTAEEWFLGATLLWLAAWGGVILSGQWRGRWAVVAVGAICAAGIGVWTSFATREPLGIVNAAAPLRVSPHGRAPGSRELPVGTAVRPSGHRNGWALVRAATGEIGWIEESSVAWVRE